MARNRLGRRAGARQSERAGRHVEAAQEIGAADSDGALRFHRATLVRPDGRPTYQLASVVDDLDLGITHVIRGKDLLPSTGLQEAIARALGAEPPEFVHHGLLVGEDGRKLSKRERAASVGGLRELGIPPEAVRAYLEELDLPRGDVHFDESRLRRLAVDVLGALSDEELAARVGADPRVGPALRGARDLVEARAIADGLASPPPPPPTASPETLRRFLELREATSSDLDKEGAKAIVRELKAVGGDLRALRLALTGVERGPELWRCWSRCRARKPSPGLRPAELRRCILRSVARKFRGAPCGAPIAPAHRDDLAPEGLGVLDLDPAEQAGLELVRDGGEWDEGDAEALLHHLLGGVDVVELHHAPSGPHPAPRKTAFVSLRVAGGAVEGDKLFVRHLVEVDAPARGEAVTWLDDEDDAVLVERRADDVGVAQLTREAEIDLLAEHELETSSEWPVRTLTPTRGWLTEKRLRIRGST